VSIFSGLSRFVQDGAGIPDKPNPTLSFCWTPSAATATKFQVLFKVEMAKYYGQLTPKCVLLEN
jgi:hypothetical protein